MGAVASAELLLVADVAAAAADGRRDVPDDAADKPGAREPQAAARPVEPARRWLPAVPRRPPQNLPGAGQKLRCTVLYASRK